MYSQRVLEYTHKKPALPAKSALPAADALPLTDDNAPQKYTRTRTHTERERERVGKSERPSERVRQA